MKLKETNPALLLVDIQKGLDNEAFYGGNRNNKNAEDKMEAILIKWRQLQLPVYHVQHSSTNPASPLHASKPGFAIKERVMPIEGEPLFVKNVNSAFIGTDLEKHLRKDGVEKLVVIGLTTNHCISTTVRMAGNLGFETLLISDATATFDRKGLNGEHYDSETIHQTTLASLHEEFAEVISSKDLLERL